MYRLIVIFATIAVITMAGLWHFELFSNMQSVIPGSSSESGQERKTTSKVDGGAQYQEINNGSSRQGDLFSQTIIELNALLKSEQWTSAVTLINNVYSDLDSQQLESIRSTILVKARNLQINEKQSAQALLLSYTDSFDDLEAWQQLGVVASDLGNWETAVSALLASSALEYEPQAYETSLRTLLRTASYARAALEQSDDELSVLALYQRLYDQHPNYSRFQLELAQAHLRLRDYQTAKSYLAPLIYDAELGLIARQLLSNIDNSRTPKAGSMNNDQPHSSASNITVPLIRADNSLLVDVSINSNNMRLLLDTGASITALSGKTIHSLGLRPTGKTINLSTANGMTQSRLYLAEELNLGRLKLKNIVVAQVNLGHSASIQGLLGTDVLKQLGTDFNYLIDDQKNALIFRRK